jgi:hypothetical protein
MAEDLVQKALEVLMPLEFYETTPEQFEKYRLEALEQVAGLCGDEEAIAAANFRRVDAKGKKIADDLGDRLASYGLGSLARKGTALIGAKRARRLPTALLLAVTPKRLFAFDASYRYSMRRRERKAGRPGEVAVWDRDATRIEAGKPAPMSTLRIEPVDGGEVVHLAGPSTADDPWSLAVMALLDPSPTSARVG